MNSVYRVLAGIHRDLGELGEKWALIGGIAVIVYAEPRTTRDVDVAVSVGSDSDAESLARDLLARGYRQGMVLDHERSGRLAMIGMIPPGQPEQGLRVDLMFAFSGIEEEIVAKARKLEVLPDLWVPVAQLGHLLALKVYANRLQDQMDGRSLIAVATASDIALANETLLRIARHNVVQPSELSRRLTSWIETPDA